MEDNFTSKLEYEEVFNPMSQFEIHKYFDLNLFGFDISFTNASLIMIFAANLNPKLNGREKYEKSSIIKISGCIISGTPLGINIEKYFIL